MQAIELQVFAEMLRAPTDVHWDLPGPPDAAPDRRAAGARGRTALR
jgi:hypothetical protein